MFVFCVISVCFYFGKRMRGGGGGTFREDVSTSGKDWVSRSDQQFTYLVLKDIIR